MDSYSHNNIKFFEWFIDYNSGTIQCYFFQIRFSHYHSLFLPNRFFEIIQFFPITYGGTIHNPLIFPFWHQFLIIILSMRRFPVLIIWMKSPPSCWQLARMIFPFIILTHIIICKSCEEFILYQFLKYPSRSEKKTIALDDNTPYLSRSTTIQYKVLN